MIRIFQVWEHLNQVMKSTQWENVQDIMVSESAIQKLVNAVWNQLYFKIWSNLFIQLPINRKHREAPSPPPQWYIQQKARPLKILQPSDSVSSTNNLQGEKIRDGGIWLMRFKRHNKQSQCADLLGSWFNQTVKYTHHKTTENMNTD